MELPHSWYKYCSQYGVLNFTECQRLFHKRGPLPALSGIPEMSYQFGTAGSNHEIEYVLLQA